MRRRIWLIASNAANRSRSMRMENWPRHLARKRSFGILVRAVSREKAEARDGEGQMPVYLGSGQQNSNC